MTVRRLYTRQTVISILALLLGGGLLFLSGRRAAHLNQRTADTGELIRLLSAQAVFSTEYVAYGYDRPLKQWNIANTDIQKTFTRIEKSGLTPEEQQALSNARWYYTRADLMFSRLQQAVRDNPPATQGPALEKRTELLEDELSEHLQSVIGQAYSLNAILGKRVAQENRRDRWVIGGVFTLVLAILVANLAIVGRRLIGPLARLHLGTRAVSRGDFGFKVAGEDVGDEIGELARSFNQMSAELSEMYARLENELEDRRRAERALTESDQRLRLALDAAEMGTCTWDIGRDEMSIDDRLAAALGRSPGAIRPASSTLDVLHPDDRERFREEVRQAIAESRDLDTTVRIPSGATPVRTFAIRGSVFRNESGDATLLSGVAWDITVKRLAEERLEASQRALQRAHDELESMVQDRTQALVRKTVELERSNADLEQFAYVASHDLQEPLRKISSYGELLQERYGDVLDERGRRYAGYMVDGVRRLQELIHALLDYSRLNRAGEVFEPVPLEAVFDRVVRDMDFSIREVNARVARGSLPVVHGNAVQLAQLFQNLLSNALKFHGERPVEISVAAEPRGQDEWTIRVSDNGIGVEPEFRDRIFVVFQRLHPQTRYPGTGIGLAVCKKIVERHGGRIWVESVPGQGASFYFTMNAPSAARKPARSAASTAA